MGLHKQCVTPDQGDTCDEYRDPVIRSDGLGGARGDAEQRGFGSRTGGKLVDQARAEGLDLIGENRLLGRLTKLVLESALKDEITDRLAYDKHEAAKRGSGNTRNDTRTKTVITDVGPVGIAVPRTGTPASSRRTSANGSGARPASMR